MFADCAILVDRAQQQYNARNYSKAASEFEAALSVCANRAQILLALGQAQVMAQQFEEGIRTFAQLIRLNPSNLNARKLSGDALYLAGKDREAEEMLKSALAIDSNHEPSLYALGRIYYQLNRFPEAVEQFQKVLEADPKSYRAHDNLGLCYDALQQDALALKHFFKALELVMKDHPDYDWAHANLAEFFLKRNQFEKAFQLAAEAAQRNPNSARNFFLTGKALAQLNKEELCLRWLRRAVELDPNYASAHYLLAQTLRRLGKEEEAQKHFEIFKKVNTNARARR
ncbi:MAG: tetratricopeptide repeat protein [Acidobacteria bacterium]|nr:tetratricopeptide repeat protein [Acidobacteriota bacterium]